MPLPSSTSQTVSRSAFGWRDDAAICETITLSMFAPRVSMFLVSMPARVSKSAISSGFFGRSTNSRNQLTENFMRTAGETANRFAVSPAVRMKFSVNWLREFVDLPKNPEEIADLLTRAGVETENIETRGAKVDKVIVSQITASSRHPNADRLTVCDVEDGSGSKRQIVCGATNYKVGDKVPLALPGAKLP